MATSSSSDIYNNIADDFYYLALDDEDGNFPISDEIYAQQLQLQEALVSSISQTNASSSPFQNDAPSSSEEVAPSSSSSQEDASSSSQKDAPSSSQEVASSSSSSQEDASSSFQKDASSSSQEVASSSSSSQEDAPSSSSQEDAPSSSSQKDAPSSSQKDSPSSSREDTSSSSSSQKDASSLIPATSSTPNPMKTKEPMEKSEEAQLPESFCGICMDTKLQSEMFSNAKVCGHLYCSDCIRAHVSVKIKENIAEVKCPDPRCEGVIGPELCRSIVPKEVLERWEDALCESLILGSQKFYCPFKDCSAMLVDEGGEVVTSSECPNCNRLFCAQCKVAWHSGMDCREYKSLHENERNPEDILLMNLAKNESWRRCPSCKFFVEKQGGCHHIACRCGFHFCYVCGKKHEGYSSHDCSAPDISI